MSVLALIPARAGSKGIPGKNFRKLGDRTLVGWAANCARLADIAERWVTSDASFADYGDGFVRHIKRPAELAQDDAPMLAVVQHALQQIPGAPEQIIVLLQPTQPFRTPAHIQQAIALLQESGADSVASVVPLPLTHHADWQLGIEEGRLYHMEGDGSVRVPGDSATNYRTRAQRRQDLDPRYIRDGTVYAFRRATVEEHGTIYGQDVRPLIIDPADSCELDTEADWEAVQTRWAARAAAARP